MNVLCENVANAHGRMALKVYCWMSFLVPVDFLAKYCIFSQEKLAEYKRAFEAVSEKAANSCY